MGIGFTEVDYLLLTLVFLPLLQGVIIFSSPRSGQRFLGYLSALFSFGHLVTVVYLTVYSTGTPFSFSVPWVPSAFVNLSFRGDGLALFFSLLITGMGSLVSLYAQAYMDHTDPRICRFYSYINVFMGAMLGAVLADNLLVLFFFWELTGIVSYLLISYDHHLLSARQAARMVFLINSLAALAFLLGITLIGVLDQTLELSEIAEKGIIVGQHPLWLFAIMVLLLTGMAGKSAQFPFHFWLPEAMAAPTPVSAYLHSATMVKLGIYLVARIYPIFVDTVLWFPLVTTLSLVTVLLGGVGALFAQKLKRILAFATVSQLGFFISFYGIGEAEGLEYDYIHIFNHALYKGSLFMLVGALAHSAGIKDLVSAQGVGRKLPLVGGIFALAIAAMAGVPGTTGFLSKELLVRDLVLLLKEDPSGVFIILGLLGGLLFKVAFSYRLFHALFLEKVERPFGALTRPKLGLLFPPFVLSLVALILGIWPQGLESLSRAFVIEGLHSPNPEELHLWHGFSLNLLVSIILFGGGVALFYWSRQLEVQVRDVEVPSLASRWMLFLDLLPNAAEALTGAVHSRRPSIHLRWLLVALSFIVLPFLYRVGLPLHSPGQVDYLEVTQIGIALAAPMLILMRSRLDRFLVLSAIGFLVTFYFILKGAPDVAMTQMVVEVATLFVIVLLFFRMPKASPSSISFGRLFIAPIFAFAVTTLPLYFGLLSDGSTLPLFFQAEALPTARGSNVVNTILVDFRGLDTFGEVVVIVIAAIGVFALLEGKNRGERFQKNRIPIPSLSKTMPLLFGLSVALSLYLHVRGHNYPGGGFIGGMAIALSVILLLIAARKRAVSAFSQGWLHQMVMVIGLAIALVAALTPLLVGGELMEALFYQESKTWHTPFLFDLGVFLIVIGGVTGIVSSIRSHTVGQEESL